MNSLQISYFLAVCKYNSFTETARKLYVSQPAISKQIFALEEELGVRLFKREYKKIYVTEEGKLLQEAFEKNIAILDEAKNKMYQLSHQNNYSLKIAVLQGLEVAEILYPIYQHFLDIHPNIDISFECLSHKKLNTSLRLNEIDYAITLHPEVANDKLIHNHVLYQTELAFTVHQSHPLYQKHSITKEDLQNHRILVTTVGAKDTAGFFNILRNQWDIEQEQVLLLASVDEVISYMASGAGIALLSAQNRFQKQYFKQFPLTGTMEIISGAWYYNNHNPALQLLLDVLTG